jgi:hypothetical protein
MKNQITLSWNTRQSPETKITFSEGYGYLERIEKLDFLQDAIGELTEKYNTELDKFTVKNDGR